MPVLKAKNLVWECRTVGCKFVISGFPVEEMKEKGFEHQKEHNLVDENKEWFNNHIHNYYQISAH